MSATKVKRKRYLEPNADSVVLKTTWNRRKARQRDNATRFEQPRLCSANEASSHTSSHSFQREAATTLHAALVTAEVRSPTTHVSSTYHESEPNSGEVDVDVVQIEEAQREANHTGSYVRDERINDDPEVEALERDETRPSESERINDDAEVEDEALEGDNEEEIDEADHDIAIFMERYSRLTLPNSTTTIVQAVLLILAYTVSAGLSWTQIDGLLKLLNALLGDNVLPNSKYMFCKLWCHTKGNTLKFYFFCKTCQSYLGMSTKPQTPEEHDCSCSTTRYNTKQLLQDGNFFMIFNLKAQLRHLLRKCQRLLLKNLETISAATSGVYTDITSGTLYKRVRQELGCQLHDLTVTFSSDGSPVFKSTTSSLWPIHMVLNELPAVPRWQNVTLAGLWFSAKHPNMFLYLKAFVDEFNSIGALSWVNQVGNRITSRVHALCVVVDSPARAALLNMKQLNGFHGCPWCYHPGVHTKGSMRYPYREHVQQRTHKEIARDMKKATRTGQVVNGIKGLSPLINLQGFDFAWSVCPDYMHCVLEGVVKQMTETWLSDTDSEAYIGRNVDEVDARLSRIRPPISFSRLPRSVNERALWKAIEWRFWLFYYCLPCVQGILPNRFFLHFASLCHAVFLLVKSSIRDDEINEAANLLRDFCAKVIQFYGEGHCTFNVHQLLHLPEAVRKLGPLWATSMFPFEGANGVLLKKVTASNCVPTQVAERCLMEQILDAMHDTTELPEAWVRLYELFRCSQKKSSASCVLGAPQFPRNLTDAINQVFLRDIGHVPSLQRFLRSRVRGYTVHSIEYDRPKKTCSRFIKMNNGIYYEVQRIYKVQETEEVYLVGKAGHCRAL
ncbi:uncharacterized protein LOC135379694 [Ornithodoros turicata]|uniref:uncharacterized protein LOC135379694 n=1 Tax=Ornithodoros turicata TaxID=34597 RepID=UPI00313864C1